MLFGGQEVRSYVWGSDLSGGEAAGGIGGLLFIKQSLGNGIFAVGYDGNGNVTRLYDMAASGALAATYEYGPFGEVVRATGLATGLNPFQWSTKYTDQETGLVCYGYRYYNAITGAWISRDPLEEKGGENLYQFASNNPISESDALGMDCQQSEYASKLSASFGAPILTNPLGIALAFKIHVNTELICCGGWDPAILDWKETMNTGNAGWAQIFAQKYPGMVLGQAYDVSANKNVWLGDQGAAQWDHRPYMGHYCTPFSDTIVDQYQQIAPGDPHKLSKKHWNDNSLWETNHWSVTLTSSKTSLQKADMAHPIPAFWDVEADINTNLTSQAAKSYKWSYIVTEMLSDGKFKTVDQKSGQWP